ncbi:MAG: gamma-glutamyltransferase [Defluviicoccus sp.]|nr:gamma-glutamyltransferase [Defluviicoccus sp.]
MRNFELPGRSPVYGTGGMAATSHPLASLTAIETLKSGGNAVDAAVAAAGVLAVVEPHMTGIGGDCFVLYAPKGGGVVAYNGSGRSPAAAELDWYLANGIDRMPVIGPHAVTVPGAVEAWDRLVRDHGRKPFGELLAPAIRLAVDGSVVHPRVAWDWAGCERLLAQTPETAALYLHGGRAFRAGEIHRQEALSATLAAIAEEGPSAFYEGEAAERMTATLAAYGGLHVAEDFAAHRGNYVEPIATDYRGHRIYECPPNGQGLTALLMFNILAGFDLEGSGSTDPRRLHLEAEAGRLAYRDRDRHVADPERAGIPVDGLLSEAYAADLRRHIDPARAMAGLPPARAPARSDTVYLAVVDGDGNAISFINSLFAMFGSAIADARTGVLFQNRGSAFLIDRTHPNAIGPSKRSLHTIMPGMMAKDGAAAMPFGVMGGHYQPFGHVHLVTGVLDCGLDVQRAIDAPRIFHFGGALALEAGIPAEVAEALAAMGHAICPAGAPLGGGQAVAIDRESGVLIGGSDPRKDGCALGY